MSDDLVGIFTCSGIQRWLPNWRAAKRTAVKNADLWQHPDAFASRREVDWRCTRGHSAHLENERADRMATTAIDRLSESEQ